MSDGWQTTERGTLVKRYGQSRRATPARSDLATPMVIGDSMPETEHVDGKFYTSKSAFRAVTKREGYIEVGNDPARLKRPERPKSDTKARREAVQKAVTQTLGA